MFSDSDVQFETFPIAADAYDWLDAMGFVQDRSVHTRFVHGDGRAAELILPATESGDQETEIKIYLPRRAPGGGA